jgi:hypothetical protein
MMKEEKESFSSSADAAFKLFGRTIDVRSGGDSGAIEVADSVDAAPCTSQVCCNSEECMRYQWIIWFL